MNGAKNMSDGLAYGLIVRDKKNDFYIFKF